MMKSLPWVLEQEENRIRQNKRGNKFRFLFLRLEPMIREHPKQTKAASKKIRHRGFASNLCPESRVSEEMELMYPAITLAASLLLPSI
jgi:hypothetical protein